MGWDQVIHLITIVTVIIATGLILIAIKKSRYTTAIVHLVVETDTRSDDDDCEPLKHMRLSRLCKLTATPAPGMHFYERKWGVKYVEITTVAISESLIEVFCRKVTIETFIDDEIAMLKQHGWE